MTDQTGGFGNYPSMPSEPMRAPEPVGPPPASVNNAVKVMFVRAGVSVLSLLVLLGTKDSLKDQILKSNPSFNPSKIDSAASVAITVGIIVGLIFIGLYVLLALQVRKGKSWARIVTLVLAALAVVSGLLSLARPEPALSRLVGIANVALDIAVIVFLAQRPSAEYFRRTP